MFTPWSALMYRGTARPYPPEPGIFSDLVSAWAADRRRFLRNAALWTLGVAAAVVLVVLALPVLIIGGVVTVAIAIVASHITPEDERSGWQELLVDLCDDFADGDDDGGWDA